VILGIIRYSRKEKKNTKHLGSKNCHTSSKVSTTCHKVKKILEEKPDLISSPSVKIQIMGGKVCLRHKGKTLLGVVNKLFIFPPII